MKSSPPRKSRHQARRFAMQAIYQHDISATMLEDLVSQFLAEKTIKRNTDIDYFEILVRGTLTHRTDLDQHIKPYVDRDFKTLSPIELSR